MSPQKVFLHEAVSFLRTLALFIIVALILRGSVVEAFKIPSGSMIPTLRVGDHILVSKFAYGLRLPFLTNTIVDYRVPARGDVVVFTRPEDAFLVGEGGPGMNIIKRVVGLPGDTVEVRDAKVYINGLVISEPYARWDDGGIGYFAPQRVPENKIFLLGDNRDHSKDSRFWSDPFLDLSRVKGKALIIYFSWDSFSRIGTLIR